MATCLTSLEIDEKENVIAFRLAKVEKNGQKSYFGKYIHKWILSSISGVKSD